MMQKAKKMYMYLLICTKKLGVNRPERKMGHRQEWAGTGRGAWG